MPAKPAEPLPVLTAAARLAAVQAALKVPKNRRNSFGNYNYRSAEDILEEAKPLCLANGLVLTVSDELSAFPGQPPQVFTTETKDSRGNTKTTYTIAGGDRFYVHATATVTDVLSGETISTHAYAREEDFKTGMDGSQLTGATSSYARKYALNGLFAIDDNKDPDTDEHAMVTGRTTTPTKPTNGTSNGVSDQSAKRQTAMSALHAKAAELGYSHEDLQQAARTKFQVESMTELSLPQIEQLRRDFARKPMTTAKQAEALTVPDDQATLIDLSSDPDTPSTWTDLWSFLKTHGIKTKDALIELVGPTEGKTPADVYSDVRTALLGQ